MPPSPYVEVTFVFRDTLQKPIEGLSVQVKAGAGAPTAPAWQLGASSEDPSTTPASMPATGASQVTGAVAPPSVDHPESMVDNKTDPVSTDKDGYAVTIRNAARNQPIDVLVKNQRGEYVVKATVTPKKDISAFTIVSPEYHLEATTKLTPKETFEQNLDLPVVKENEVMTIERLVQEFGPYIGWSQKITEQGRVKKDFPVTKREVSEDEKTHKKTTKNTIEHHIKIVDTGKPTTVVVNALGSRLNYPKPANFSEEQYKTMATKLNVEVAAIKAIVMQESSGRPFLENGLPPIRYERHIFYNLAQKKLTANAEHVGSKKQKGQNNKKHVTPVQPYPGYPDLCFPKSGGYGPEGLHQYEKVVRAAELDLDLALQACSWGGFQIMGYSYASCGCSDIYEFANKFISGTDGQVNIFILFMQNEKPDGIAALRTHNWEGVASAYNGGGWKTTNPDYAKNLGDYYAKFK